MRQDAALEEGVELIFDEPGQLGAGAGLGVRPRKVSGRARRLNRSECRLLVGAYLCFTPLG